jgi:hypothetical protein
MQKKDYIVEENLNFFDLLKQMDTEEEQKGEVHNCKITGEPLYEDAVTLICGHSFNYDPLFLDVYEQKRNTNMNEIKRVGNRSIRCPYCRQIQQGCLLPPRENKPSVFGVNFYSEDLDYVYNTKNIVEIPTCNYPGIKPCTNKFGKKINDDQYYCQTHLIKSRRLRLYEMDKIYQEFLKQKNDALKQSVLLLKNKYCVQILKSGLRKGQECRKKTKHSADYCLKHQPKTHAITENI